MQIDIIKTERAHFVKINICVILKTLGHGCTCLTIVPYRKLETVHPYIIVSFIYSLMGRIEHNGRPDLAYSFIGATN